VDPAAGAAIAAEAMASKSYSAILIAAAHFAEEQLLVPPPLTIVPCGRIRPRVHLRGAAR
jgi:hypothetical protein